LGGSTPVASGDGSRGGRLVAASTNDATSFHRYQTTDSVSATYQEYVYGGGDLVRHDRDTLELAPNAAERFDVSADRRVYTFTLRDLRWSDGAPLTTADYVWTFEQARKAENRYPFAGNLAAIDSYLARDPRTLVVTLREAGAVGLEEANQITPLPKHIWERYPWGDPAANPEINKPTVGSGMWNLREWRRNQSVQFVANEQYHGGRPKLDEYTIRILGSQALVYEGLKTGEIDYAGFQPTDYREAKGLPGLNVYEWYPANPGWSYIGFNFRRPTLQDPRVRRAIAHATDRGGIIDALLYGLARPTYANYPPSSPVYNPDVERYDFDPDRARSLFREAGYDLAGGKLTKGGRPLALKLLFGPATSSLREGIATILQQELGRLGLDLEVQGLETGAYLDRLKSEPFDYDLWVLSWSTTVDPHYSYQIWSEASIPSLNNGAYVNKEVERLYAEGLRESDRDRRRAIYGRIQRIINEDLPYVFLYTPLSYVGVNKRIGGIVPKPNLINPSGIEYNMHEWFVRA